MFEGLAKTLELHRRTLVPADLNARKEDEVYGDLASRWKQIAELVAQAARQMAAQRELPVGAHVKRHGATRTCARSRSS